MGGADQMSSLVGRAALQAGSMAQTHPVGSPIANSYDPTSPNRERRRAAWVPWAIAAGCLSIVAILCSSSLPYAAPGQSGPDPSARSAFGAGLREFQEMDQRLELGHRVAVTYGASLRCFSRAGSDSIPTAVTLSPIGAVPDPG